MGEKDLKKILAMLLAIAAGLPVCRRGNSDKSNDGSTPGSDAAPGTDVTAASDYEELQDKGTMVVGITDFAPMDYRDDNGEWTGFDAELARLVASQLGLECEFIEIDWDNKILELESKVHRLRLEWHDADGRGPERDGVHRPLSGQCAGRCHEIG